MGKIDYDKINPQEDVVLVDKSAGVSSFKIVSKVRWELTQRAGLNEQGRRKKIKVGHTGTLDPFATGLLILLVGKATKKSNEYLKKDKEYVANVRMGATSDTGDVEGKIVVCESGIRIPSEAEIANVVKCFVGEIEQRVPVYSAVKINGQRAYNLARKGKEVEMPTRKVFVYGIDILEYEWPNLKIRCKVSSGTYIRQLGMDIGEKLGVGGYLTELRRISIDKYLVEDAVEL